MFVETRDQAREFFLCVWTKMGNKQALEPLESLVARVITEHPQYHAVLEHPHRALEAEFDGNDGRSNPFLHMGLHVALVEQLQTDRPAGIRASYKRLLLTHADDSHRVEHRMMDCLAQALFEAANQGNAPDQNAYLQAVQGLS